MRKPGKKYLTQVVESRFTTLTFASDSSGLQSPLDMVQDFILLCKLQTKRLLLSQSFSE